MNADLKRQLVELGRLIEYPKTPQLATLVRSRLHDGPQRAVLTRGRAALVAVAAMFAVVLGVPPVRTAVAHWLGIQGIVIKPVASLPPVTHSASPGSDFGIRTTLVAAQRMAGFAIAVPSALGPPDAVYTRSEVGPVVSLAYRPRAGFPESRHTGVGVLITEFRGSTNSQLMEKFVGQATTITPVTVSGESGFWIDGVPHEVAYQLPDGSYVPDTLRLAGPTLIFQRGDVTVRIEGSISQAQALAVSASMR